MRDIFYRLIATAMFLYAISGNADVQDEAYALYQKAQEEYEQNDFQAALRYAKNAIKYYPHDGTLKIAAKTVLYRVGNRRSTNVSTHRIGKPVSYKPNALVRTIKREEKERQARALKRLKAENPPSLILDAQITDEVQDGYVQTEEQLTLRVTLTNVGKGKAENVRLKINSPDQPKLLNKTVKLHAIGPNSEHTLTEQLALPRNYNFDYLDIELTAWEQDGFNAEKLTLKPEITAWSEPSFELTGVSGPKSLQAGQVGDFSFEIRNALPYPIRNESFQLEFDGSGIRNMIPEWPDNFALIMPNETLHLSYKIFADHDIEQASLSEIHLRMGSHKQSLVPDSLATHMLTIRQADSIVQYGNSLSSKLQSSVPLIPGAYAPELIKTNIIAENNFALVIGNSQYKNINQPVRYARNDAKLMADVFSQALGIPKSQIFEHHDMTLGEMQSWLGSKESTGSLHRLLESTTEGDATVYIYYSGHGAPAVNKQWAAYLTPTDANPDYIEHTGYPLEQLYTALQALPAKQVIVMLDACFSGQANDGLIFENISPLLLKEVLLPEAVFDNRISIITAASANDMSIWLDQAKQGLFTTYLAKGLAGKAAKDGKITTGSLFKYVSRGVRGAAARLQRHQAPTLSGNPKVIISNATR